MKRKILIAVLGLIVIGAGAWFADRTLKGRDHPGLSTFLHQWWVNYPASFAVEPMELSIHVDQADLDALEVVVEAARERGVIMPEGNDYVPAVLEQPDGTKFKAKLRIKGKMSDHVKGSKWSFRVIAKKDNGFLGMQRFSLQHPGTRNYLCDWFYHRLMKGEGIIALRYGFIRLKFNDEDLGIYAYEEHFGPELLANNGRLNGPLFRFDPGLFWEHRLNMMEHVRYDEPFGAYEAAAVDAFGSDDLKKDTVQRRLFELAVSRMDAFRRGRLRASEVFDADKIARRHALLDLVGGHHSMDWSDVKFYFDPVTERIEPLSYESFSAFPIRTLAGADRFVGQQLPGMDLHDAYFNDTVIFKAYVHHLERMSRASYLDSAFTALSDALDSASALIYREFPYKELDRSIYSKNQFIIRKILDVPKGFHAYLDGGRDTLRINVVPLEGLPMEVHGVIGKNGVLYPPTRARVVPCRMPGRMGVPLDLVIPVDAGFDRAKNDPIMLRYSVLGASVMKELEVFPYAYSEGLALHAGVDPAPQDLSKIPFLDVDDEARTISFVPGKWILEKDLMIPVGYTVKAVAPLRLDLQKGARIISHSPMTWSGMEGSKIVMSSSDGGGGGILLLGTGGPSVFRYTRFEGFGPSLDDKAAFIAQNADVEFTGCDLGEVRTRDVLLIVRSKVRMSACSITGGKDQLTLAYCATQLTGLDLMGAGDDAISVKGGMLGTATLKTTGVLGSALKMDEFAEADLATTALQAQKDAVHVSEGAHLKMTGGSLASLSGKCLDVDPLHARHGASHVELDGVDLGGATAPFQLGKGNTVKVNGVLQDATAKAAP